MTEGQSKEYMYPIYKLNDVHDYWKWKSRPW